MPAPTFVATSIGGFGSTITRPTVSSGQLLVLELRSYQSDFAFSGSQAPSGWTFHTAPNSRTGVYIKTAGASEPSTYTAVKTDCFWRVTSYADAYTPDPIIDIAGATVPTYPGAVSYPSVVTENDSLGVWSFCVDDTSAPAALSGTTVRHNELWWPGDERIYWWLATQSYASAGTTGTKTHASTPATDDRTGYVLVLRSQDPAPAPVVSAPTSAAAGAPRLGLGLLDVREPLRANSPLNRGLQMRLIALPGQHGSTWYDIARGGRMALADGAFFDGPPQLGSRWQDSGGYLKFPLLRQGGWGSLNFRSETARSSALLSNVTWMPTGSRSAFCWVYPTRGSGSQRVVHSATSAGATAVNNISLTLVQSSGQKLSIITTGSDKLSTSNIPDGVWTHIGIGYDHSASLLRIYVNGQLDATHTSTTLTDATTTDSLRLGWTDSTNMFCGGVDDVCIFNRFIENIEARSIYDDSRQGHPDSLNWQDQQVILSTLGKRSPPYTAPSIFPVRLTI